MAIERISATDAARNFSDLLNRVRYQGGRFEIARGTEVVARIVPAEPSRAANLAELDERLAQLPKLDADDSAAFENDLLAVRGETTAPEPEWD